MSSELFTSEGQCKYVEEPVQARLRAAEALKWFRHQDC